MNCPASLCAAGQFQVFYMTPDKERLIPGVMWDAAGKNITRKQIADIPGAVPTVVVGSGETGQGPAAASVANAIANATGKRLRDLPMTRKKIKGAIDA